MLTIYVERVLSPSMMKEIYAIRRESLSIREWISLIIVATMIGTLTGLFLVDHRRISYDPDQIAPPLPRFYPLNNGICIFISDAASGIGRESALMLADSGVHVLAGAECCCCDTSTFTSMLSRI